MVIRKLLLGLEIMLMLWMGTYITTDKIQEATKYATKYPIAHPSAVNVRMQMGQCSGVVAKKNYILTAAHCIESDTVVYIAYLGGEIVPGVPVYVDKVEDYAIIKTDTLDYPVAVLNSDEPDALSPVGYVRYNQGDGGQLAMNGIYAYRACDITMLAYKGCLYFIAMAGVPGDSGGAIFNKDGEVIGIMSMSFWPMAAPMSMAVPVEHAIEKLKELH